MAMPRGKLCTSEAIKPWHAQLWQRVCPPGDGGGEGEAPGATVAAGLGLLPGAGVPAGDVTAVAAGEMLLPVPDTGGLEPATGGVSRMSAACPQVGGMVGFKLMLAASGRQVQCEAACGMG